MRWDFVGIKILHANCMIICAKVRNELGINCCLIFIALVKGG